MVSRAPSSVQIGDITALTSLDQIERGRWYRADRVAGLFDLSENAMAQAAQSGAFGRFRLVAGILLVLGDDLRDGLDPLPGFCRHRVESLPEPSLDCFVTRATIEQLRPHLKRRVLDGMLRRTQRFSEAGPGARTYRWGSFLAALAAAPARSRQAVQVEHGLANARAFGRQPDPSTVRAARSPQAQSIIDSITRGATVTY